MDDNTTKVLEKGFLMCSAEGERSLIYADESMYRLFGCESEDGFRALTQNSLNAMIHPNDLLSVEAMIESWKNPGAKPIFSVEHRIRRANGNVLYVRTSGEYMPSDTGATLSIFMDDITEERRIREERQNEPYVIDKKQVKEEKPKKEPKPKKESKPKKAAKHTKKTEKQTGGTPKWAKRLLVAGIVLIVLVCLYLTAVFSSNPFISKWRTIYIETAMSTNSHQWLATYFIPKSVIDEVMNKRKDFLDAQLSYESNWGDLEFDTDTTEAVDESAKKEQEELDQAVRIQNEKHAFYEKYWELDTSSVRNYLDEHHELTILGYDDILVEDLSGNLGLETVNGDPVLVIDAANNLLILGVKGDGYQGKLAIVKDSKQVELSLSDYLGSSGQLATEFCQKNDAVLTVNASGFVDVGGVGSGGTVRGSMIKDGVEYGTHDNIGAYWKFVGMKNNNRLYIGNYENIEVENFKWGVEFYPALIIDGEYVVDGTEGMGIQPRTTIGQTQDGSFLMLVVDGRQIGYSLGCTVADCAGILINYGAYEAFNLDGGSSSVMIYKGLQITKSSSQEGIGRYMPDALIVRKWHDIEGQEQE